MGDWLGGIVLAASVATTIVPTPNVWCDDGTEKWGEGGMICHARREDRVPLICAFVDTATGVYVPGSSNRVCTIPNGWSFPAPPASPMAEEERP